MLVLLGISLLLSGMLVSWAPLSSAPIVISAHEMCLNHCPTSRHALYLKALVCGESLSAAGSAADLKSAFIKTGLIHLLVVSGSHLICLEELLSILLKSRRFRFIRGALIFCTLIFFALATGASPPVLRSLFQWCLRHLQKRLGLKWSSSQILIAASALTLATCRTQMALASLSLSWLAAIGIRLWSDQESDKSRRPNPFGLRAAFEKLRSAAALNACVYLALAPALWPLGIPHPLSILFNLALAPVIGLVFFPLSLVTFFPGFAHDPIEFLMRAVDGAWDLSLWAIQKAADFTPQPAEREPVSLLWILLYILLLSFFTFARDRQKRADWKPS